MMYSEEAQAELLKVLAGQVPNSAGSLEDLIYTISGIAISADHQINWTAAHDIPAEERAVLVAALDEDKLKLGDVQTTIEIYYRIYRTETRIYVCFAGNRDFSGTYIIRRDKLLAKSMNGQP